MFVVCARETQTGCTMRKVKSVQTEAAFCWTSIWVWQHFNLKNKLKKYCTLCLNKLGLQIQFGFYFLMGFWFFVFFDWLISLT